MADVAGWTEVMASEQTTEPFLRRRTGVYPWQEYDPRDGQLPEVDESFTKSENARWILASRMKQINKQEPRDRQREHASSPCPFAHDDKRGREIWREEIKRAFGLVGNPSKMPKGVGFLVGPVSDYGQPFWIEIRCDWCGMQRDNYNPWPTPLKLGCIVCGPKREFFVRLLDDPEFNGLLRYARERKHPGPISDWLQDDRFCCRNEKEYAWINELAMCFYSIFCEMES